MVRSHAKNNTTQSTLSYYERSLLRRQNEARRIGQDSMKPLDHCNLCLSRVTDAVACPEAHIFCRECCYSDLLAQKAGIEQQKAELDAWEREDERKRWEAREKARERVVANFERGMGLSGGRIRIGAPRATDGDGAEKEGSGGRDLEAEVERIAREAEDAALAAIQAEESDGRKAKIAAFWLPDNAPEAPLGPLKQVRLQTLCHVGAHPHPISLKALLPVQFTYPAASKAPASGPTSEAKPGCPSCLREVNNATGAVLLTARKEAAAPGGDEPKKKKKKKEKKDAAVAVCGHVVCATCAGRAQKGGNRCPVCEEEITRAIPLGKEGTGFAAAGHALAKADVVTFRV